MSIVGRLDQYASMLATEFDETTAKNTSITGLGTYYASEFNENIVDIVRDGLLLNLDAGNLSSYPGSGTTWTDLSGRGTVVNLSSTSYTTDAGGGIYFSSSASSAGFTATLNFSGGFTLETWIKHTGVVSTARVQRYMTISSSPSEGPVLRHNASTNQSLHGYLFDSGNTFREIDVAGQILTNTYYHLVYTYDGTTFRLYKNNVQVGTLVATVTLPTIGTTHSLAPGGVEYFEGNMYAARYYNRGLTAAEVSQNYNALATRFNLPITSSTAPMSANVFAPYDPVYDEFSGTFFGAGQGRYMRQNTDKSVIVYNEIDEVTDFYNRGIVRDGLVLDLDAGISASYSGSGTAWTDLSPYSNNGTLVSGPTYSSTNGGSFTLNGSTQYATITGYKGITGTAARTSIIWFKTNVLNASYRLLGWGTTTSGSKWNISLDATTYRVRAEIATGAVLCNSGTPNVADTNWHMVATTAPASGTANDIKVYIDGNLITDVTITSGATAINTASSADVSFGASLADAAPGYLNGNIAIGQIYNRALTAAEISQNYNALKGRFGL